MKSLTLPLSILCCLLLGMQVAQGQCASYNSPYPPPYPESWPCMSEFLTENPACCTGEFDQTCVDLLRLHCDADGELVDCRIDHCSPATQQCEEKALPVCPDFCPSYFTSSPPPGPNLPVQVDGKLVELFQFDGFCCQTEFDNLCWDMLNNIAVDPGNPGLGPICSDGDPNTIDGADFYFGCTFTPIPTTPQPLIVQLRVLLEGPYDETSESMRTDLRDSGLLPVAQPFNEEPWNYAGSETAIIGSNIPTNAVDWILIEIRDAVDCDIIRGQRAGFLLSDGTLQDVDGTTGLVVPSDPELNLNSNYYVVARARGHLAVATAMPVFLPNRSPYDFTIAQGQAFGNEQMANLGNDVFGLLGGDINGDGVVTVADFNVYQPESGSVNQYLKSDVNKDKSVTVADFNLYQPNAGAIGDNKIRY